MRREKNAKVTLEYQHELPDVPGKSIKGVLVEYGPCGAGPPTRVAPRLPQNISERRQAAEPERTREEMECSPGFLPKVRDGNSEISAIR